MIVVKLTLLAALLASSYCNDVFEFPGVPRYRYFRTTAETFSTNQSAGEQFTLLQFHWDRPLQTNQMIKIVFISRTKQLSLTWAADNKKHQFMKEQKDCYFFLHPNETSDQCHQTAGESSGCENVTMATNLLNIVYENAENDDKPPDFKFNFTFVDCKGNHIPGVEPPATPATTTLSPITSSSTSSPRTTSTSTNGIISTLPIITKDYTTNIVDVTTTAVSTFAGMTTPGPRVILPVTSSMTQPTTARNSGEQNGGLDSTIIIVIVIVLVFFILIAVLLFFCGRRFRRYQKQMKKLTVDNNQSGLRATTGDPLYEEIVPQLPTRNINMQEPGYEIPICAMKTSDSTTVENELYHRPQVAGRVDSRIVENRLYHETNLQIVDGNERKTVYNELYHDKEINANTIKQEVRDDTSDEPQLATDIEPESADPAPATAEAPVVQEPVASSTVDNVLYNL